MDEWVVYDEWNDLLYRALYLWILDTPIEKLADAVLEGVNLDDPYNRHTDEQLDPYLEQANSDLELSIF